MNHIDPPNDQIPLPPPDEDGLDDDEDYWDDEED